MPRRGENIFKRKDGRWEARYIYDYDNGKKKKFVIKNVLEPELSAFELMEYVANF